MDWIQPGLMRQLQSSVNGSGEMLESPTAKIIRRSIHGRAGRLAVSGRIHARSGDCKRGSVDPSASDCRLRGRRPGGVGSLAIDGDLPPRLPDSRGQASSHRRKGRSGVLPPRQASSPCRLGRSEPGTSFENLNGQGSCTAAERQPRQVGSSRRAWSHRPDASRRRSRGGPALDPSSGRPGRGGLVHPVSATNATAAFISAAVARICPAVGKSTKRIAINHPMMPKAYLEL